MMLNLKAIKNETTCCNVERMDGQVVMTDIAIPRFPEGDYIDYRISDHLDLFCKIYTRNKENLAYRTVSDDTIIYYTLDQAIEGIYGFSFIVLEMTGRFHDEKPLSDGVEARRICYGEAKFDGVRHIWFGDIIKGRDKGYIPYPNIKKIKIIMEELMSLEDELCDKEQIDR